MDKITFCIPTKNNLRYLKNSIQSIKNNSAIEHDIIVFVDANEDNTEQWLIDNHITYLKNTTSMPKGIAYGYNRCIELSTTDIVCMFHADMYMAKGFDTNMLKHLKPGVVVSATRIEPPLHPAGLEKIIENFGMYPEDFQLEKFNAFVDKAVVEFNNQVTYGIFAPWLCYKNELLQINLHDEYFHSYNEDSDIFNRMILSGMACVQSRDAFVYHLTCRGGQFQDGIENVTTNPQFHFMKNKAQRHYLRKWGSWIQNDAYQHPIIPPKYNIAFVIRDCNYQALSTLEPWCDRVYIEDTMQILTDTYIQNEQPNTLYDLQDRVLCLDYHNPIGENDIIVEFSASQLTQHSFGMLQQLPEIITESGEVGQFELDCFKITINNMQTYEKDLIACSTSY